MIRNNQCSNTCEWLLHKPNYTRSINTIDLELDQLYQSKSILQKKFCSNKTDLPQLKSLLVNIRPLDFGRLCSKMFFLLKSNDCKHQGYIVMGHGNKVFFPHRQILIECATQMVIFLDPFHLQLSTSILCYMEQIKYLFFEPIFHFKYQQNSSNVLFVTDYLVM